MKKLKQRIEGGSREQLEKFVYAACELYCKDGTRAFAGEELKGTAV